MPDSGYPDPQLLAETLLQHAYAPLSFLPGWRAYEDGYAEPGVWVDGFGIAHLRGRVFSDFARSPPVAVAALPDTFDGAIEQFVCPGTSDSGLVLLDVYNGELIYGFGWGVAGLWFDISGITYPT